MRVLFVAAEASPFVKTGGLADVIGSLPRALQRSGRAEVCVALPKYNCIDTSAHGIAPSGIGAEVPMSGHVERAEVWECRREVPFYFIGNPGYFDRDHPYHENGWDYSDNAERFTFFSRAVVELCHRLNFWPDILHCHDWHTALIPLFVLMKSWFLDRKPRVATVLTVHNVGYQGRFGIENFWHTGLPTSLLDPFWGLRHGAEINFLRCGVMFSDIITTVSPRYSEEIKFFPMGSGLEDVFRYRAQDLFGILNGIDTQEWNPAVDPFLPQRFDISDFSGKMACKRYVQSKLGLPVRDEVPLLAAIIRLSEQKGIHLIDAVIGALEHADVQFVLAGAGHPEAEERARYLSSRYAEKFSALVGDHISYDPAIVHQIEAAADMLVMPSLYEPCGLNQMFSLRYGTVPVVRATGGLDDTVREYNPVTGEGNGFKFYDATPKAFAETLARAIHYFRDRKDDWSRIMRNGMCADSSWDAAVEKYLALYEYAKSRKMQQTPAAGF